MTTKLIRKIVIIDEEKCDGCGVCVPSCAEGALQIIDGKARLISETYCDGLGACLGKCPQDAITVEEREAKEFDEAAVEQFIRSKETVDDELSCGCPSTTVARFERQTVTGYPASEAAPDIPEPTLSHWPVQMTLVPPSAPFLKGTDLLLTADCVPFAYPGFHQQLLNGHALVIACPKLDDFEAHRQKLTAILSQAEPKSLTVVHMEVPCCFGLVNMAQEAITASGRDIPFRKITVSVRGELIPG